MVTDDLECNAARTSVLESNIYYSYDGVDEDDDPVGLLGNVSTLHTIVENLETDLSSNSSRFDGGAKGRAVLPLFPNFRQFFHFHKNPSSSVISGTFSRENRFPPKRQKRPKIAKHTKHEPLPKRDAISLKFP
jgi:hypothetical protein